MFGRDERLRSGLGSDRRRAALTAGVAELSPGRSIGCFERPAVAGALVASAVGVGDADAAPDQHEQRKDDRDRQHNRCIGRPRVLHEPITTSCRPRGWLPGEVSVMMRPMAYTVPDLPYPYDALEPHIGEQTMRFHHDKHHQAYVDKPNEALAGTGLEDAPPREVLTRLDGVCARQARRRAQQRRGTSTTRCSGSR